MSDFMFGNLAEAERRSELRHREQLEAEATAQKIVDEHNERVRAEDARRRTEARAQLEDELHRRFMALPGSTETDWLKAKDRIISDHFAELMKNQELREDSERANYKPL